MVFRSDITVDWTQSPRLIFVASPSTEVIIQDLHDTLRRLEERFWEGLTYPSIIETAGKEELGGSVTVGLTAKLLNARLAFQARKTSTETGTVTTADTTGRTLTDSAATFVTNGVQPGAWITNLTDGSRCSVLKVLSQTQLYTDILGDGIDNQFGLNDLYEVQNVTICEVSGGNLVAVGSDGVTPITAILPTAGTQVVRTSSSSATLQELQDIQFSSFGGGVTVDLISSYSGTDYPVGTARQPVNNFTDALSIANSRGFVNLYIIGNATINSGLNFQNKIFHGQSTTLSTLTINASAQVSGCEFNNATVIGTLDGDLLVKNCLVGTVTYVDGTIDTCGLTGTITLSGTSTATFMNCWDAIAGVGTPTIDCGSGTDILIRNYYGGLTLRNKTGTDEVSIDLSSGRLILENTITNGSFIIRGIGHLTNNTTGSATVDATNLVNPGTVADAVWDETTSGHTTAGTFGGNLQTSVTSLAAAVIAADLTVASGSTTTEIRTAATQTTGFYDGLVCVIINSAGTVARTITAYSQTNGAFTLDIALPFTPTVGNRFIVLGRVASAAASVDNNAIAIAVWARSILSPDVGSYGELANKIKNDTTLHTALLL